MMEVLRYHDRKLLGVIENPYIIEVLAASSIKTSMYGQHFIPISTLDYIDEHIKRILAIKLVDDVPELLSDRLWVGKVYKFGDTLDQKNMHIVFPALKSMAENDKYIIKSIRENRDNVSFNMPDRRDKRFKTDRIMFE